MQPLPSEPVTRPRDLTSAAVMVGSGLVNVAIVAWWTCPQPLQGVVPWWRVFFTSVVYLLFSVVGGIALAWGFWRIFRSEFLFGFRELAIRTGTVWVFVPALVFLVREDSPWACLLMMVMGGAAAQCLRSLVPASDRPVWQGQPSGAFALLPAPSGDIWPALAAAVSVEISALALGRNQVSGCGLLLAAGAFLFQWQMVSFLQAREQPGERIGRIRLGVALLAAILLTVVVLLVVRDRSRLFLGFRGGSGPAPASKTATKKSGQENGIDAGYRGIILWTVTQKKNQPILAPRVRDPLEATERRPIVIPFDGPYWYFKPPHDGPGKDAHVAHGDPAKVNIRSVDWLPLLMEAHQSLASSVALADCSELQIHVRNADNEPGSIVLGVVLSDSTLPGKPSLALGGMPISSTQPGHFTIKAAPVEDTLRYAIPAHARISKFNQISVVFFPAEQRAQVGVKIALQDFVLIRR
jgi:hypothetical protein